MANAEATTAEALGAESPSEKKRALLTAFLTGFVINLFLYTLLRVVGSKWIVNMFGPIMMCLALLGTAAGALAHSVLKKPTFLRFEPLLIVLALVLLACVVFNYHLAMTYLIPMMGFGLYKPDGLYWHVAGEILIFLTLPFMFVLPSWLFAECFHKTSRPYLIYAAHIFGFLLGGLAGFFIAIGVDVLVGIICGILILMGYMFQRRKVFVASCAGVMALMYLLSFKTPHLFYTWGLNEYKILDRSVWSPYFKLDFISFDDDHCISGVYNNIFLYYTCDTAAKSHQQVREIYKELARDKERIMSIGGSLGTSMRYFTAYQNALKEGVSVEIDPVVAWRSWHQYSKFSGDALRDPRIEVVPADGRRFLELDDRKYDLIFLDGIDNGLSFSPLSQIAVESYLFTKEGYKAIFDSLSDKGIMTIDLGGTTQVDYIRPFLAAMPENVYKEVFWYVVPDRPMIGLSLWFIVASKNKEALEKAANHVKSLPSVKYIGQVDTSSVEIPTDNHPIIRPMKGDPNGINPADLFAVLFLLLFIGAAYYVRRKISKSKRPPAPFPYAAFTLLGFAFIFIEFSVTLKHARLFLGPAYGMTLLTSFFMAGAFLTNLAFTKLKNLPQGALIGLAVAALAASAGLLYASVSGLIDAPAKAAALALLMGVAGGYYWPFMIHTFPNADRRMAYGIDTIGSMVGGMIFQFQLLGYGFVRVSALTGILIAILIVYTLFETMRFNRLPNAAQESAKAA